MFFHFYLSLSAFWNARGIIILILADLVSISRHSISFLPRLAAIPRSRLAAAWIAGRSGYMQGVQRSFTDTGSNVDFYSTEGDSKSSEASRSNTSASRGTKANRSGPLPWGMPGRSPSPPPTPKTTSPRQPGRS